MKIGLDFQQHLIDELQKMAESTDAQEVKDILRRNDDGIASRKRTTHRQAGRLLLANIYLTRYGLVCAKSVRGAGAKAIYSLTPKNAGFYESMAYQSPEQILDEAHKRMMSALYDEELMSRARATGALAAKTAAWVGTSPIWVPGVMVYGALMGVRKGLRAFLGIH